MNINSKSAVAVSILAALWFAPMVTRGAAEMDGELDQALALQADIVNGARVYKICVACHTSEAWGSADGNYPQLAGQHKNVILKQLADIRAGNRDTPTMLPFAQPGVVGGPQALADVAGYLSTLLMNSQPGVGGGNQLQLGQQLYEEKCTRCHGDDGAGDNATFFPRIHGQHYAYLLRQLKWIRDGKRRNVYRGMKHSLRKMTDADFEALADYVSRLKPPLDRLAPVGWKNPDFSERR